MDTAQTSPSKYYQQSATAILVTTIMDANAFFMGSTDRRHAPLPLTLDRVMENRPFRSDSPLFSLPIEILTLIFEYIDDASLPTLAFVNDDFHNVARSRQFSSVHLNYSKSAEALVNYLLLETYDRLKNNGPPSSSSLGACIRRLTVSTSDRILQERFDIPAPYKLSGMADVETEGERDALVERFSEITKAQWPRWQKIYALVEKEYLSKIQMILALLPHLETLAVSRHPNRNPLTGGS